jgi:hypothetical protein
MHKDTVNQRLQSTLASQPSWARQQSDSLSRSHARQHSRLTRLFPRKLVVVVGWALIKVKTWDHRT